MKRSSLIYVVLLAPSLLMALDVSNNTVECKVSSIEPKHSNFFSGNVIPPEIGDEISIDLNLDVIDDLTFKSGNALPLKAHGAKIKKVSHTEFMIIHKGDHTGTGGIYKGHLISHLLEKNAHLRFQVLRERQRDGYAVHTLDMNCVR